MSKLQRKATQDHAVSQETTLPMPRQSATVSIAGNEHAGVASPARDLMAQLNYELTTDLSLDSNIEKYPLKWTVIGLTLFCGLSWYGLLSLML